MKKLILLCITAVLLSGMTACIEPERRPYYSDGYGGYDRTDRYDIPVRIEVQKRRIDQGIASGELTRREADMLIDNLNWIRDEYSYAKRDGRLTQAELDRLANHLDQNSRMIWDKKNNEVKRVYTPPPHVPAPAPVITPQPDFLSRIENQQKRIDQGITRGDLTRQEAEMLQDNLNNIRDEYRRMKADGRLTPAEADRLERDLETNSRMIQDKRTNQIRRLYQTAPVRDHERPSGILSRIERQQRQIDDGVRSGELTRKEAEIVQENLNRIKAAYNRMKADGKLSEKEQERLDRKLERNERMIINKKNNSIERFD